MREARAFVLCISQRSIESAWTSHELKAALDLGLDVVPVMIEPIPLQALPEVIRNRHIINLHAFTHRNAARATAFSVARTVLPEITLADHGDAHATSADSLIVLYGGVGFQTAGTEAVVSLITAEELTSPIVHDILDAAERARAAHLYIGADANGFEAAYLIGALSTRVGARRLTVTQTLHSATELRDVAVRCGANHRVVTQEHLRADVFEVAGALVGA
jgi:hypothetical protein